MKNKKGEVNWVLVSLVLGALVLVVLALGFGLGWSRFLPFISSSNNIENIKTGCATACATNNVYNYCTLSRDLKAEDLPNGAVGNCSFFSSEPSYIKYGIETCSTISCNQ